MAKTWVPATAKKWSAAASWEPSGAPAATEDAIFNAAAVGEAKVEAAALARSLIMTGYTGTLNLSIGNLELGSSTAQAENIVLKLAGTLAGTQKLKFVSTFTTTAQQILSGGKAIPWTMAFAAAGKWSLSEGLALMGTAAKINLEAGELLANGQTIEVREAGLNATGASTLDLTGSTLIGTGTAEGFNWASTGPVVTNAATVIEIGSLAHPTSQFGGGGKSYKGVVRLNGREVVVDSASGQTWETVEVLNKGTGATGQKWKAGAKSIFTTLVLNGTVGEPNRVETSKAGERHQLEHLGGGDYEVKGAIAIKDFEYLGGTLYAPEATLLENTVKINKEAKPSAENKLVCTVKATVSSTATPQAAGSPRATVTGLVTASAKPQAAGNPAAHMLATVTGKASASATGTPKLAPIKAAVSSSAKAQANGVLASQVKATVTAKAAASAAGVLRTAVQITVRIVASLTGREETGLPALLRFSNWKTARVQTANQKTAAVKVVNQKAGRVETRNQ